jgi:predicted membrane protein
MQQTYSSLTRPCACIYFVLKSIEMNEEKFESGIENRWAYHHRRRTPGRIGAGLFLLFIGALLLLDRSGSVIFPNWVFDWPGILLAIGLFTGIRHGFRGGFWLILLFIGGLGIVSKTTDWNLENYIFPIILIAIGLGFLFRPRHSHWRHRRFRGGRWPDAGEDARFSAVPGEDMGDRRDFLDVSAVFGGVKKNILSKNFRGGDVVSFMGGSEIDLSQADFTGRVRIDVTNIFGGTKLVVPATWDIQSDITAIFGGVDDKRQISGIKMDTDKVLVLDGTCMFGGIEIRNY